MSLQTATAAAGRMVVLSCGSLALVAVAVAMAPLASAHALSLVVPIGEAMLAGAAAMVLFAGRRLTRTLRAADAKVAQSRSQLQSALDNMSQGLVLCDTQANVVAVNNRFLELFGIHTHRVRHGMTVADLIRLQAEMGAMTAETAEILVAERLNRPPGASGRTLMPFPRGVLEVAYQPRPDGGWACTFEDVTAQKEAERRLAFLAQHDSLTGLPNRALLRERIDQAIAAGAPFAIMLVDLDHFKLANDTFGHAVGDALLCAVSERLCAAMRDGDTVARLGGDEFALLMAAPCSPEEADRHAARLIHALAEPFEVAERVLRIGGSIGVSLTTNASSALMGALDADTLLHRADIALYRAKEAGRRVHCLFEPSMARSPLVDCV